MILLFSCTAGITVILVNWSMVLECVRFVLKFVTRATSSATQSAALSSATVEPRRTRVVKLLLKEYRVLPAAVKQRLLLMTTNHLQPYHLGHPSPRRQRKVSSEFLVNAVQWQTSNDLNGSNFSTKLSVNFTVACWIGRLICQIFDA